MSNAQNRIEIRVGGQTLTATLADTEAARQLQQRLAEGAVTVRMNDYGGFEKVGDLPWSLPTSNRQLTTSAGDIMLYQGRSIVIFYGQNSWSYTPLGRIDDATAAEIREFLSGSPVDVTFTAAGQSAADNVDADNGKPLEVTDLQGRPVRPGAGGVASLPKGVYIVNGRKTVVK